MFPALRNTQANMQNPIPDILRNPLGERLDFTYHAGAQDNPCLVLLGHGVTGNKDRPLVVALAEAIAKSGIHALRFSFSGNGGSEGRFEESTVSKEVADLGAILDSVEGWQIGYAGHSMGAAVGVLRAASDERIQFLISLGGMAHTADFARREFSELTPGSAFMWDNPACPLSQAYMEDMSGIASVLPLAKKVHVPWLFVHGLADDVVPPQDSRDLMAAANPPKRLVELPEADHVFSGAHAAPMTDAVVAWLRQLKL